MSALLDVKTEYAGRWDSVLKSLGMPVEYFRGKHGDCPVCQDQRKNARWHPAKQYNVCSKCGITNPMDLAMLHTGENFKATAQRIRGERISMEQTAQATDYEKNKARLQAIHKTLEKITPESKLLRYFANRGLSVFPQKDCYYSASVPYYEDGKLQGRFPAMVTVLKSANGETCTYHITYLSDDCKTKRDIEVSKKVLPAIRTLAGSAIQLFQPEKGVLAVAEGIETALAVHQLEGLPVWATGNAWQMEVLEIPADIKELHIYADSDESFTGQQAAYTLAKRMKAKGVKVRVHMIGPDSNWFVDGSHGGDFLDFVNLQRSERLAQ